MTLKEHVMIPGFEFRLTKPQTSVFDGLFPQQPRQLANPLVLYVTGIGLQCERFAGSSLPEPDFETITMTLPQSLSQAEVGRLQR